MAGELSGAPRRRAALLLMVGAALLALAGCGGGGPSAPSEAERAGTQGRIYPPVSGVVMVEYASDGSELQRTPASDADGRFGFPNRLSGARIESLDRSTELRVASFHASRAIPGSAEVTVTPLTTLFDAYVQEGSSESSATEQVRSLLTQACGDASRDLAPAELRGDAPVPTASGRLAVLVALDGQARALRRAGRHPGVEGLSWTGSVHEQRGLLGRMCLLAQSVRGPQWQQQATAAVVTELGAGHAVDRARLEAARDHALAQVLELMAVEVALSDYPELAPLLGADVSAWRGTEGALLLEVAQRQYVATTSTGATVSADAGSPPQLSFVLQNGGRVVGGVAGKVEGSIERPPTLRLLNAAEEDRTVRLSINGTPMFDMDNLVMQVVALPLARRGEPLYERAWRFVVAWRRHTGPITAGRFQHQADLFLRSVGSGFCDDVATVLYSIWSRLGYQARIWGLMGHVVPEVWLGDRWAMYDPDLAVFYRERSGSVASVDDLVRDPSLITSPVERLPELDDWPYSSVVADTYASAFDNDISFYLMEPTPLPLQSTFTLPRGGHLEIVGAGVQLVPSVVEGERDVALAPVRLWIPPGYAGELELPLVLVDGHGDATVEVGGLTIEVANGGLSRYLRALHATDADVGVSRIGISDVGPGGLTLVMVVNPLYFRGTYGLTVRAFGERLSGLSFEVPPAPQM